MSAEGGFGRIEECFREVSRLSPEQRGPWLDTHCGSDRELRQELEALLAHDAPEDALLETAGRARLIEQAVIAGSREDVEPIETLPRPFGRYTLTRLIGRGGMGVVYEAEQDSPRRTVALKLILTGTASHWLVRRFEQEAEVLARLEHPAIARVYDAGSIDRDGARVPFFAMELVRGLPLLEYAERHALTVKQKLDLVASVAEAMHHAHARSIVHRDLKPANILVEEGGQPKVLDFGIARITDADVRTTTLQTSEGQLIGTVAYMSPEQATGDPTKIDHRSDVYALGVVAFELITGRLPLEIGNKLLHEAVRAIREDAPTPLLTLARGLDPDIQTIIGKALSKEKERRYASAADFATDIRRFLESKPISARPPSTWYQMSKFAKRHTGLVAGASAAVLMLVIGTVVSTVLAVQATRAKEQALRSASIAQAVSDFLNDDLLAQADPYETSGAEMTVREAMNRAAPMIGEKFGQQPEIEARLRLTIGSTYFSLGAFTESEQHLLRAAEMGNHLYGPDAELTLDSRALLAMTYDFMGRADEALPIIRDVAERRRRIRGPEDATTLSNETDVAVTLMDLERYEEASEILERILPASITVHGDTAQTTQTIRQNLARVRYRFQDLEGAAAIFEDVVSASTAELGEDHPETLAAISSLALVTQRLGRTERAQQLYERAVPGYTRVLGAEHPFTLTTRNNLALFYSSQDQPGKAERIFRDVLAIRLRTLESDNPDIFVSQSTLGALLSSQGEYEEAERLLQAAYLGIRSHLVADHPYLARTIDSLIDLYERWDKPDLAAAWKKVRDLGEPPPLGVSEAEAIGR